MLMVGMAYHYTPILTSLKSKGIMINLSAGQRRCAPFVCGSGANVNRLPFD
jgi:hypothetical protein